MRIFFLHFIFWSIIYFTIIHCVVIFHILKTEFKISPSLFKHMHACAQQPTIFPFRFFFFAFWQEDKIQEIKFAFSHTCNSYECCTYHFRFKCTYTSPHNIIRDMIHIMIFFLCSIFTASLLIRIFSGFFFRPH